MGNLTENQQQQLEDYLEGRLSGEERSNAEKWLLENPEGRQYLEFLTKLRKTSPGIGRKTPPADLTDKVMEIIASPSDQFPRLSPWSAPGWTSACLLLALLFSLRLFYHENPSQLLPTQVPLSLHAPGAKSVEVAGDFTGWKKLPLENQDGWWRLTVKLVPEGAYQYAFILNGKVLVLDPRQGEALRDRRGDFYSVISFATKDRKEMEKTTFMNKTAKSGSFLAACLSILLPAAAFADSAPAPTYLSQLQQKTQSSGLSDTEFKSLLQEADKLEKEGLTDKTLGILVDQSLVLGTGPAVLKTLDRVVFLVAQGMDAEEAGQVSLKEVEATQKEQEKTLDKEMAETLALGLKNRVTTSKLVVLTQKQLAEKLEQKREEWEEHLENQKRIQAIQNDSLELHK